MNRDQRVAAWQRRFYAAQIYGSTLAKGDPSRGLIASNRDNFIQWFAWDVASGSLSQITDTDGGHANGVTLAPDGESAYTLQDFSGNETGHYVQLSLQKGEDQHPVDISPDLPLYSSFGFHISGNGQKLAFIAAYDDIFHIYTIDRSADGQLSPPKLVAKAVDHLFMGVWLSYDGEILFTAGNRHGQALDYSTIAYDTATGEEIGLLTDGPGHSVRPIKATARPNGRTVLATTSLTGSDTLLIWNPITGERQDLDIAAADISGSIRAMDWSPDEDRLLCFSVDQAVQTLFLYQLSNREITPLRIPPGTVSSAYFVAGGDEIYLHHEDSTRPAQIVAVDGRTGAHLRSVFEAEEMPPGQPYRSIHFASGNGQQIQAWVARPDSSQWGDGPYPTVINTHGGPQAVQTNSFQPHAQAWLDHGFLYASINYQGSITFGKAFQAVIWGDLGNLEVEDVVAGRQWLVDQGLARPDAVFLEGRSYGGYLTLQSMGREPGLWAGGMATVPIADWSIQYEDTAETLRKIQVGLLGGTPSEIPEQYAKSSPITYAEQVDAPVLIIQGRHDTRTPARPVEMYVAKMKGLGKEIEVEWYDTGHAGAKTSIGLGVQHMEMRLAFAQKILGEM